MLKSLEVLDIDNAVFKPGLIEELIDAGIDTKLLKPEPFNCALERGPNRLPGDKTANRAYLSRLVGKFVDQMAGVEVEQFDEVTKQVVERRSVGKFKFSGLMNDALKNTHYTLAISDLPDVLISPFLKDLKIDLFPASGLIVEDGKFTAEVEPPVNSVDMVHALVAAGIASNLGSVGIGSTYTERPVLNCVTSPIVFNGDGNLVNYAQGRLTKWPIVSEANDQIRVLYFNDSEGEYSEIDPFDYIKQVAETSM